MIFRGLIVVGSAISDDGKADAVGEPCFGRDLVPVAND